MRTPDRVPSIRHKAATLALLIGSGLAAFAVMPIHAMDAAAVAEHEKQDKDGDRAPPPRHDQRREERPAIAGPPAGAPPAATQQQRQDSRPSPQLQPQFQGRDDNRGRGDPRDRDALRGRTDYRADAGVPRSRDGVVFGPPRGTQGPDARIVSPARGGSYGYNRPPPPDRVVQRLPPGYRQYNWGGSSYYHHGGRWYRPYGSSFVIVGAPFGLYVPYLPAYYTTFWFGGLRYYLADDTYYLYEPDRHGYVVTRSPYGDDRDDQDDNGGGAPADHELFVYPMRGQSERQQADDRYECHRWAVDQAHYDPTDAEYRAEDRAQYDRALTACLTGRGYSVK
jgi:hypothetical protein